MMYKPRKAAIAFRGLLCKNADFKAFFKFRIEKDKKIWYTNVYMYCYNTLSVNICN